MDHVIEVSGCPLFVFEKGSGPPVVFLHGGLADHRVALPLVSQLDGFRVVTPDLRGSGRSRFGGEITFELLSDDILAVCERLGLSQPIVGGVSSGSGIALHFALRYPRHSSGLMLIHPIYGGGSGFDSMQRALLEKTNAAAQRTLVEGMDALRPLYEALPAPIAARAWAMAREFDPSSVAATSSFLVSGGQPFKNAKELADVRVPPRVGPGVDALLPAELGYEYGEWIPNVTVTATPTPATAMAEFCAEQTSQ
jgi:pimeloyl-ACP methyl ester carboxylesterase